MQCWRVYGVFNGHLLASCLPDTFAVRLVVDRTQCCRCVRSLALKRDISNFGEDYTSMDKKIRHPAPPVQCWLRFVCVVRDPGSPMLKLLPTVANSNIEQGGGVADGYLHSNIELAVPGWRIIVSMLVRWRKYRLFRLFLFGAVASFYLLMVARCIDQDPSLTKESRLSDACAVRSERFFVNFRRVWRVSPPFGPVVLFLSCFWLAAWVALLQRQPPYTPPADAAYVKRIDDYSG